MWLSWCNLYRICFHVFNHTLLKLVLLISSWCTVCSLWFCCFLIGLAWYISWFLFLSLACFFPFLLLVFSYNVKLCNFRINITYFMCLLVGFILVLFIFWHSLFTLSFSFLTFRFAHLTWHDTKPSDFRNCYYFFNMLKCWNLFFLISFILFNFNLPLKFP